MAANVKFRLLSTDALLVAAHTLTPATLYRGMVVYVEYHEIYTKNEGTVLNDPTHTLTRAQSEAVANAYARKVTGSAKDGGSTSTIYIAYGTPADWNSTWGPTAISDGAPSTMANGRCYDLWTKYLCSSVSTTLGTHGFTHTIGGNEP